VLLGLAGCGEGGGPAGGGDGPPPVTEASYFIDQEMGAALEHRWQTPDLRWSDIGCVAAVSNRSASTVPPAHVAMATFELYDAPAGGDAFVSTRAERFVAGSAEPVVSVEHDLATICADDGCQASYFRPSCAATASLADEGLLALMQITSNFGADDYSVHYLVRYTREGALAWKRRLEHFALADGAALLELASGDLVVAYGQDAPQGHSTAADNGLLVRVLSPTGDERSRTHLRDEETADTGDGLPGRIFSEVKALQRAADGGFVLVGSSSTSRSIECGSQDAPRVPAITSCSQSRGHGLVARFGADGSSRWARRTGVGFYHPGTELDGVVELEDGSIAATGRMETEAAWRAAPSYGAALVRVASDGALESLLRVAPHRGFFDGPPRFLAPIARAGGEVDVLATPIDGDAHRLLRLGKAGTISAVRTYRPPQGPPTELEHPSVHEGEWIVFDGPSNATTARGITLSR